MTPKAMWRDFATMKGRQPDEGDMERAAASNKLILGKLRAVTRSRDDDDLVRSLLEELCGSPMKPAGGSAVRPPYLQRKDAGCTLRVEDVEIELGMVTLADALVTWALAFQPLCSASESQEGGEVGSEIWLSSCTDT